jgi:APA family basic amino acid/polyamine antiporter
MVGVGPFVTIPLLIGAMGGPQCLLGWAVGTVLALSDGLVWAELAAAMPGEGGSYLYLREAFRRTRLGTLLPFLFIWQFVFSGPLEIASGYIGFAQYLSYFRSGMGAWEMRLAVLVVGVLVIALLYRGIQSVGRLTVVLWIGMLATVAWIVAAGFAHFDARRAFDFPPHAFAISPAFMAGLGGATLIAMYNFLGYYGICFVGGEVRRPERTMPRSIVLSVLLVGAMYALMTVAIMAVVPWREAAQSKFVVARFMEMLYGPWAGRAVTVLILWSAVASVFALLLAYSRVPYAAALAAGDRRARHSGRDVEPRLGRLRNSDRAHPDSVHRPDCGGGGAAQIPAGHTAPVSDVALSAAQRAGAGRLGVRVCHLRLDVCAVRGGSADNRGDCVCRMAAVGRRVTAGVVSCPV